MGDISGLVRFPTRPTLNWITLDAPNLINTRMSRSHRLFLLIAGVILVFVWFWIFPPRWWLNTIKPVDLTDPVGAGITIVGRYNCQRCHLIDGAGKAFGPDLKGVTKRLDAVSLRHWLRDPSSIKWKTSMPNFQLSDPEIEAIVSYLAHLDGTRN
jgi:mono/diheme cytochrome c family protein